LATILSHSTNDFPMGFQSSHTTLTNENFRKRKELLLLSY